ncbi:hypothetical protein [Endozoicomonas sp. OPT23]|uniref:hypothetical protein n=1 Tax=Endozoicomonas sp. OPT23 TaxID=2072845 RepID=UPI001E5C1825|nr:hypothetical protein [Endozoicomonas sp. OPT23]
MAVFRLTRGIDSRDVANAHLCAVEKRLSGYNRFIISGETPFKRLDCDALCNDAKSALTQRCPEIVSAFRRRGWQLPASLDRVHDSSLAHKKLGWLPKHGFESVLEMLDTETAEVLPVSKRS